MKCAVALLASLLVVAPSMGLQPREATRPINPRHTLEEWAEIMDNLEPQEEVCLGCKPGTEPQSPMAGFTIDSSDIGNQIINGKRAKTGQFPYQVGITMDGSYFCGGSIISDRWILTAGHCVDEVRSFSIVYGTLSPMSSTVVRTSTTSFLHEEYDSDYIINDIGLVAVSTAVSFNTRIAPVKLPSSSEATVKYNGKVATISGWGRTSDYASGVTQNLMYVALDVVDNSKGAAYFGSSVRSTNIVCDGSRYKSTCNGDSGGPLVLKEDGQLKQIGIVSYGAKRGCAKGYPSVFTKVASYIKWIEDKTGLSL